MTRFLSLIFFSRICNSEPSGMITWLKSSSVNPEIPQPLCSARLLQSRS